MFQILSPVATSKATVPVAAAARPGKIGAGAVEDRTTREAMIRPNKP